MAYSEPATITISVLPINEFLAPRDDSFSIPSGLTLDPDAPGVLANDTAAPGVTFTAVLEDGPAHASVFSLAADGSFEYKSAEIPRPLFCKC